MTLVLFLLLIFGQIHMQNSQTLKDVKSAYSLSQLVRGPGVCSPLPWVDTGRHTGACKQEQSEALPILFLLTDFFNKLSSACYLLCGIRLDHFCFSPAPVFLPAALMRGDSPTMQFSHLTFATIFSHFQKLCNQHPNHSQHSITLERNPVPPNVPPSLPSPQLCSMPLLDISCKYLTVKVRCLVTDVAHLA